MENYQMQEDWNKLISTIAEEKILGIFYWREDRAYVIIMPTATNILTVEAREFGMHLGTTIVTIIPFTYLWSALQSNEFDVNINCIFSTPNFLVNPYYSNDFYELCQAWIIEKDIFSRKPYDCEKMLAKMSDLLLKSLSVKQCDSHKFKETITKTEEKALKAILIKIGREGVVSVSELIKETKISRPVFSSLLEKLSKFNCANVQNMGVKGTHLVFSQEILNYYQKEI